MKIELFTLLMKMLFWETEMFKLATSSLYDQTTFYDKFHNDMKSAKKRVVIESSFITAKRTTALFPVIAKLRARDVDVIINTKPFDEHEIFYRNQAIDVVGMLQDIGVTILMTRAHHRKIAIIDDILYEGSSEVNTVRVNDKTLIGPINSR